MNCLFCNQECTVLERSVSKNAVWLCPHHKGEVILRSIHVDGEDELYMVYCKIPYKDTYYIAVYRTNGHKPADIPYPFSITTKDDIIVMDLDHFPNVQPDKLADKLPLWLTFS